MMATNPTISADPVLAEAVRRANRAHLFQWITSNIRDPGAPVPVNLDDEVLDMARDLVRRGLDLLTLDVYRAAEQIAWRHWLGIAFDLTSDPQELRELLDVTIRSLNEYVEAAFAGIGARLELEYDELTRERQALRLEVVETVLHAAHVSSADAAQLGYPLDCNHTAVVVWKDNLEGTHRGLDRVAHALCDGVESTQNLIVVASAATRWMWLADVADLSMNHLEEALKHEPAARVAIGTTAAGIGGFRRSHRDALTTQRTLARLQSLHRAAFFTDVRLVALLTQDTEAIEDFVKEVLGDLAAADQSLRSTLLTYINEQCNASRAAKRLYAHRNTVLRRVEQAQELLPHPLTHNAVHVALALEALQWLGSETRIFKAVGRQ